MVGGGNTANHINSSGRDINMMKKIILGSITALLIVITLSIGYNFIVKSIIETKIRRNEDLWSRMDNIDKATGRYRETVDFLNRKVLALEGEVGKLRGDLLIWEDGKQKMKCKNGEYQERCLDGYFFK